MEQKEKTVSPIVVVTGTTSIAPIPEDVLGQDGRAAVDAAIRNLDPAELKLQEVILLGADAQDALGKHIDRLLGMISRKDAPMLYELFEELRGGLKKANLDELEKKVRAGQRPWKIITLLERVMPARAARRLKRMTTELRELITQKSKTLLDLVNGMETKAKDEVRRLVESLSMLDQLAQGYLDSVKGFGVATAAAYELLTVVQGHERMLVERANRTKDPQDIAAARNYSTLVEQLQNRALTLRTAYEQVPAELDIMTVAKGAASTTLAETANGIRQQFNDMKSALVKWHVLLSVQELQASDLQRREIVTQLRTHNVTVLDRVATTAATMQGDNRLQDAQLLLGIAQGLGNLRDKLSTISEDRKRKFEEAEKTLNEARSALQKLPAPAK